MVFYRSSTTYRGMAGPRPIPISGFPWSIPPWPSWKGRFCSIHAACGPSMAMTAHVVFSALDPVHPATTSATIIGQVICGVIGFQGLLMSDDVSRTHFRDRSPSGPGPFFAAGCDLVLHCNGKLDEMRGSPPRRPNCRAGRWSAQSGRWRHARLRCRSTGWRRGPNWMR